MKSRWDELNVEYAEKGWPSIDPRSSGYCYQPCDTGIHVCGFHPDGNNFLTIANFKASSAAEARAWFEKAKADLSGTREDGDFVIDLQVDSCVEDDFYMSRQMLDRLAAITRADGGGA